MSVFHPCDLAGLSDVDGPRPGHGRVGDRQRGDNPHSFPDRAGQPSRLASAASGSTAPVIVEAILVTSGAVVVSRRAFCLRRAFLYCQNYLVTVLRSGRARPARGRARHVASTLLLACALAGCSAHSANGPGHAATPGVSRPGPPAADLADATGVRAAEIGVVKVVSSQPACGWQVQSTGFAISPHHVMTLASNVAGSANGGLHVVDADRMAHAARVVLFDPMLNIAVLDVPTLSVPTLSFASTFTPWSRVAIAGYVRGGARPTVTTTFATAASNAATHGIYGGDVNLQVILVQASAVAGESGAPVLNRGGRVDAIIDGDRPGSPAEMYALSQLQVQSDAAAGSDRTTAISDGKCVSSS
jgi:hypothetical protein